VDFKVIKELVVEFGMTTVNDIYCILFHPKKFHQERLENPEEYFNHGLVLWGLIALLLSILSYFVTSSATIIRDANIFLVGSTLFNFIHGLFIAVFYVGIAKLFQCKESIKINLSLVLYSFSILPIIAFLTIPLEQTRISAMVNDQTLFSYGYVIPFRDVLQNNVLIQSSNIICLCLYLYFAYLTYVGFKEANKISGKRAFIVAIVGLISMNIYSNTIMLPIGQMFIKSMVN
jgi:hypothetical protein